MCDVEMSSGDASLAVLSEDQEKEFEPPLVIDVAVSDTNTVTIEVKIEHGEFMIAAIGGVMRRLAAIKGDKSSPWGEPESDADKWGFDIESNAAEQKVAKWLNVYHYAYSNNPRKLPGDAGEYQVRHTRLRNGSLILHERDKDDATFILVVGDYPKQKIVGWIKGIDGKQQKFWDSTKARPAYFIKQAALRSPEELLELKK